MKLSIALMTIGLLLISSSAIAQTRVERPANVQLPANAMERVRDIRQPSFTFEVPLELNQIPASFSQLTVRCFTRAGSGGGPAIMEGETRVDVPADGNFSDTVTVPVYPIEGQDINRASFYVCNI